MNLFRSVLQRKHHILIPYPCTMALQVLVGVLAAYQTLSSEREIAAVVESEGDKMLVFGVQWCGHCKKFEYVAHELVQYLNIDIYYVDCVRTGEYCYNHGIDGYPTIYLVKDKKLIEYVGLRKEKPIENWIYRTLNKTREQMLIKNGIPPHHQM